MDALRSVIGCVGIAGFLGCIAGILQIGQTALQPRNFDRWQHYAKLAALLGAVSVFAVLAAVAAIVADPAPLACAVPLSAVGGLINYQSVVTSVHTKRSHYE